MQLTIVVDSGFHSKEQIEDILNGIGTVEFIEEGEHTNKDYFSVIRWSEDDVKSLLEKNNYPVTDDNIMAIIGGINLEDRAISSGWEQMEEAMRYLCKK